MPNPPEGNVFGEHALAGTVGVQVVLLMSVNGLVFGCAKPANDVWFTGEAVALARLI